MSDNVDGMSHDYSRYTGLGLSLSDGIMTVTLSNPGRKNAITARQSDELVTIWDDLWEDPEVQIIILTGEGDDFCSGADVSGLARRAEQAGAIPRSGRPAGEAPENHSHGG